MKNKDRRSHCLVTDYYDKGWLDLDAVMEAISDSENDGRLSDKTLHNHVSVKVEEKRRQILAWMELAGASVEVKEALRTGYYTEEQMDALHDIWLREMRKSCADQMGVAEKRIQSKRWRDYGAFRSGVGPLRVRDHDFVKLGERTLSIDNID